jgi:hypothetical protein
MNIKSKLSRREVNCFAVCEFKILTVNLLLEQDLYFPAEIKNCIWYFKTLPTPCWKFLNLAYIQIIMSPTRRGQFEESLDVAQAIFSME